MAMILLNMLINVAASKLIKEVFKQPRPVLMCEALGKCNEYGMPSSHAQIMAFVSMIAWIMWWHRRQLGVKTRNTSENNSTDTYSSGRTLAEIVDVVLLVGLSVLAIIVSWARVYLGYHRYADLYSCNVFEAVYFVEDLIL